MTEREELVETIEIQTAAVTTPAPLIADRQGNSTGADGPIADLSKVRELVLKAHPDVVPDLIAGGSVDELIASVEPARTAYQRIAEQVRSAESSVVSRQSAVNPDLASGNDPGASSPAVMQPPQVPAGGGATVVDPGDLAPTSNIAQALAARKRKS